VVLNLFQTYQAHWGPFESDMMNKAYYQRIFAKTFRDPYDRLLLDTGEGFFKTKKNVTPLYADSFESLPDTLTSVSSEVAFSGKKSLVVNPGIPASQSFVIPRTTTMQPGKWLYASAWFYTRQNESEPWWMPQMVLVFEKNGQPVRERIVRPMRVLGHEHWREVWMNVRLPKKDFDAIRILMRNPRNVSSMWMDDLKVELFEE
jgi:hypothetical protein